VEESTIQTVPNGPYKVLGPTAIVAVDARIELKEGEIAFLCRCGQSRRKPLCDGSHRRVDFQAE
jgi:CDGSH-type Zn-finger protein